MYSNISEFILWCYTTLSLLCADCTAVGILHTAVIRTHGKSLFSASHILQLRHYIFFSLVLQIHQGNNTVKNTVVLNNGPDQGDMYEERCARPSILDNIAPGSCSPILVCSGNCCVTPHVHANE